MLFKKTSVKFIGARTRKYLNLTGAAPEFGINRGCYNAQFVNNVDAFEDDGIDSQIDALIHHIDAVSRHVQGADPGSGKIIAK